MTMRFSQAQLQHSTAAGCGPLTLARILNCMRAPCRQTNVQKNGWLYCRGSMPCSIHRHIHKGLSRDHCLMRLLLAQSHSHRRRRRMILRHHDRASRRPSLCLLAKAALCLSSKCESYSAPPALAPGGYFPTAQAAQQSE